jgi:hypothetical protein
VSQFGKIHGIQQFIDPPGWIFRTRNIKWMTYFIKAFLEYFFIEKIEILI